MKCYWMVGPTCIEKFDSIDEAVEEWYKLGEKYTFKIGEKECTVDRSEIDISWLPELLLNNKEI